MKSQSPFIVVLMAIASFELAMAMEFGSSGIGSLLSRSGRKSSPTSEEQQPIVRPELKPEFCPLIQLAKSVELAIGSDKFSQQESSFPPKFSEDSLQRGVAEFIGLRQVEAKNSQADFALTYKQEVGQTCEKLNQVLSDWWQKVVMKGKKLLIDNDWFVTETICRTLLELTNESDENDDSFISAAYEKYVQNVAPKLEQANESKSLVDQILDAIDTAIPNDDDLERIEKLGSYVQSKCRRSSNNLTDCKEPPRSVLVDSLSATLHNGIHEQLSFPKLEEFTLDIKRKIEQPCRAFVANLERAAPQIKDSQQNGDLQRQLGFWISAYKACKVILVDDVVHSVYFQLERDVEAAMSSESEELY